MTMSPTQRSMNAMRESGRRVGVVERFLGYAGPHGVRKDLFGFIDIIAIDDQEGIVGVQACGGSGFAAHRRKIVEEKAEEAKAWLRAGGKIELWAWCQVKMVKGGTRMVYKPRIDHITIDDITGPPPEAPDASEEHPTRSD